MAFWDKIKKTISPEDDDNTYDDYEFEDEYATGGGYHDSGQDMSGGVFRQQQTPVYPQNAPNYNDNYQQQQQPPPMPVSNSPAQPPPATTTSIAPAVVGNPGLEVRIVKPETFMDGRKIAGLLMERKTVVVNFDETNKEIIRRLLDFMAGMAYAIDGEISKVSPTTFIVTPPNAKASHEQLRNAERPDMAGRNELY